jgi:hypothetical protein
MGPLALYVIFYVYTGIRAQREIVRRATGLFWAFKRESYSDAGWKWHILGRRMFIGFIPVALILIQVARLLCPDFYS